MRELGISIYPTVSRREDLLNYIALSASLGFTRVFTSLLFYEGEQYKIFKEIIDLCNSKSMKVSVDVAPDVFKKLKIDFNDLRTLRDLKFFKDLGVYAIRIDQGWSGLEESFMTYNDWAIKIELNSSSIREHLETIMSYKPNKHNLSSCHNFYPHINTGLSRAFFRKATSFYTKYGIQTAAFISSPLSTISARGEEREGVVTLEEHRGLSLVTQAKDLFKEGMDTLFISNCYPSEEELSELAAINRDYLELKAELESDISELEREIVLDNFHFYRGDVNEWRIRSTMPRVYYKGREIKTHNTRDIKRGDILIDSSAFLGYSGELQIALKAAPQNGKINVVGRIVEEELSLLESLTAWDKFKIVLS